MSYNRKSPFLFDSHPSPHNEIERLSRIASHYKDSMEKWLHRMAGASKNSFLDIGCGPGFTAALAQTHGYKTVVGLDISFDLLTHALKNTTEKAKMNTVWVQGNMLNLPFKHSCFDAIVSRFAIKHVNNPETAIHEMIRILKPGGSILVIEKDMFGAAHLWNPVFLPAKLKLVRTLLHLRKVYPKRGTGSNTGWALKNILASSGMIIRSVELDVCPMTPGDSEDSEEYRDQFLSVYRNNSMFAISQGLIPAAEAEADMKEMVDFINNPRHFAATLNVSVLATKEVK